MHFCVFTVVWSFPPLNVSTFPGHWTLCILKAALYLLWVWCKFLVSSLLLDILVMDDIFAIKNAEVCIPYLESVEQRCPSHPNLVSQMWPRNFGAPAEIQDCTLWTHAMPETTVLVWSWAWGKQKAKEVSEKMTESGRQRGLPGFLGWGRRLIHASLPLSSPRLSVLCMYMFIYDCSNPAPFQKHPIAWLNKEHTCQKIKIFARR